MTKNGFHPFGVLSIKQLNLFQVTYHPKHGLKQVLSNVDIQHYLRHSNMHVLG